MTVEYKTNSASTKREASRSLVKKHLGTLPPATGQFPIRPPSQNLAFGAKPTKTSGNQSKRQKRVKDAG